MPGYPCCCAVEDPSSCVADFSWAAAPWDCTLITFTDLSTSDGSPIAEWLWHFGDGGTSAEQHPTHNYGAVDTYTVTLRVTLEDDTECEVYHFVEICEGEDPPYELKCNFVGDPGNVYLPDAWEVELYGYYNDPNQESCTYRCPRCDILNGTYETNIATQLNDTQVEYHVAFPEQFPCDGYSPFNCTTFTGEALPISKVKVTVFCWSIPGDYGIEINLCYGTTVGVAGCIWFDSQDEDPPFQQSFSHNDLPNWPVVSPLSVALTNRTGDPIFDPLRMLNTCNRHNAIAQVTAI